MLPLYFERLHNGFCVGWSIKHLLPCKRNNHFCIYFALEESGRKGFGVLLRFKQENSFQPAKPEAAIFWLYFTSGKEKRKMRFRAFPRLFCFLCWYHDWHWLRHVGTLLFALQRDTLFDIFLHFCSSQKMGNGGLWLPTLLNFIRAEDFAVEI